MVVLWNTHQRWKPSSPGRYVNRAMSLPSRKGNVETRALPEVKAGDYLVLHDTGAYGASMSSNYNSRPLLPEVLFDNGQARLIRRRQTIEELLALELL